MSEKVECQLCEETIFEYTLRKGKVFVEDTDESEYYENDDSEYICKQCYHSFRSIRVPE